MNPVTYYLARGRADFEVNRTKELVKASWVAWPNDMSGAIWLELAEAGPEYIGGYVALVLAASRSTPRWHLIDELNRPHTAKSLARTSRLPEKLFITLIAKLLDMGVLAVDGSQDDATSPQQGAGLPQDDAVGSPAAPQEGASSRTRVTYVTNGTNGTYAAPWRADLERFRDAYPKALGDRCAREFISVTQTADDEVLLYQNLALHRKTWSDDPKYIPSAYRWLNDGLWKVAPKQAADSGPRYAPLED